MEINGYIASLDLEALKDLNRKIVRRINDLDGGTGFRPPMSAKVALRDFKVGDLVSFNDRSGRAHKARIIRINSKTATCTDLDSGRDWRVSPAFLHLVGADKKPVPVTTHVTDVADVPGDVEAPVSLEPTPAAETFSLPTRARDGAIPTAEHAGTW